MGSQAVKTFMHPCGRLWKLLIMKWLDRCWVVQLVVCLGVADELLQVHPRDCERAPLRLHAGVRHVLPAQIEWVGFCDCLPQDLPPLLTN